jgi:hypothetical protein
MVPSVRARPLAALLALLFAAPARAEEAPKLDYVVASDTVGCPSDREFRAAVTARVGRDPFVARSDRTLRVDVRLEDGELAATGALVEVNGDSSGLRRITGKPDDCREVVDGMALAVSLAIAALAESSAAPVGAVTPSSRAPSEATTDPPPPAAAPRPEAPAPSEVPSLAPAAARRDVAGAPAERGGRHEAVVPSAGIAGHVTTGVGPGVGVGGALWVRGRQGSWSLSVEGRLDGFGSTELGTSGSVTSSLLAAVLSVCGHRGVVMLCPLALAGSIGASSSGIRFPDSDAAPYVALGGRFGVEWPLSPALAVQGRLDGLVTLLPVDIELDGDAVWSSPFGSAALGAGLLGTFR